MNQLFIKKAPNKPHAYSQANKHHANTQHLSQTHAAITAKGVLTEIYTAAKPESVACWDGNVFLKGEKGRVRSGRVKTKKELDSCFHKRLCVF